MAETGNNGSRTARRNRREQWVLDVLRRSGSEAREVKGGVYAFHLADLLRERLGRDELHLTFQKRLAQRDGVELASQGSWLHDQLLRYAREWGRGTLLHLPPRSDVDLPRALARRRLTAQPVELLERGYHSLLVFTFRVFYYSEPPVQKLSTVIVDCTQGKVIRRGPARRQLDEATASPREEFSSGPAPDREESFRKAWEALEDVIEREVHELQEAGKSRLEVEIGMVERYYRQLIDEEKKVMKSRTSKRSREEGEQKLELLKVEWQRRIKEETERLRPQVVAGLTALARLEVPCERWKLDPEARDNGSPGEVWFDLSRGEVWPVAPAESPDGGRR